MLSFNHSADPKSLDIVRKDKPIGFLQWHSEREPRVILFDTFSSLSIEEMQQCINRLKNE